MNRIGWKNCIPTFCTPPPPPGGWVCVISLGHSWVWMSPQTCAACVERETWRYKRTDATTRMEMGTEGAMLVRVYDRLTSAMQEQMVDWYVDDWTSLKWVRYIFFFFLAFECLPTWFSRSKRLNPSHKISRNHRGNFTTNLIFLGMQYRLKPTFPHFSVVGCLSV